MQKNNTLLEKIKSDARAPFTLSWLLIATIAFSAVFFIDKKFETLDTSIQNLESLAAESSSAFSSSPKDTAKLTISDLNRELIDTAKRFKKADEEEKPALLNELSTLAQQRKNLVLEQVYKNPSNALSNTLHQTIVNQLPSEILPFVEQKKQIRGELEYIIIDHTEKEIAFEEFFVTESKSKKRYKLYPSEGVNALTGDEITIDGYVLDNTIVAKSKDIKKEFSLLKSLSREGQSAAAHKSTSTTTGTKTVLVILMNWQDDPRTPFSVEEIRGLYFTNPDSARNFYLENTSNAISLVGKTGGVNGDVHGWVTIPNSSTNCNYNDWATSAKNAVQSQGISTSGYDLISFVLPFNNYCQWGGMAQVGGQHSWVNIFSTTAEGTKRTISHEIGHNFGRLHAGSMHCTLNNEQVSVHGDCTYSEYGDLFDVMGTSLGVKHMNVFQKGRTGSGISTWLPSSSKLTVSRSTSADSVYTIVPQASNLPGIKSLRIPVSTSNTGDQYYYVELRKNIGLDQFTFNSVASVTQGVGIRKAPDYGVQGKSFLIDANPQSADPSLTYPLLSEMQNSALPTGKVFTDPNTGINIETVSVSEQEAQVRVFFTNPSCTNTDPQVSISPSNQYTMAGGTLTYQINIQNIDSTTTCSGSQYLITPTLPSGFVQSPENITTTLINPGQSQSLFVNITSPDNQTTLQNPFSQTVTHTTKTNILKVANATFSILTEDLTPPGITLISPTDGSTVPNKGITINTTAGDSSGIGEITIIQNEKVIKTCVNTTNSTSPVNCSIKRGSSDFIAGINTITITAKDKSLNGNTQSKTITVLK